MVSRCGSGCTSTRTASAVHLDHEAGRERDADRPAQAEAARAAAVKRWPSSGPGSGRAARPGSSVTGTGGSGRPASARRARKPLVVGRLGSRRQNGLRSEVSPSRRCWAPRGAFRRSGTGILAATAGRASWASRRRRWDVLLAGFGAGTTLDLLTPARIQAFVMERALACGAQTIRNDLSLLSSALKLARRMRHESGFSGNPLLEVERPRGVSKPAAALPDGAARALIAAAWRKARSAPPHLAELWRDNAAMIELMYETSSRISQILSLRRDQIAGGVLRFPGHKGGAPREFEIAGRIAAVLKKLPDRGLYLFPARATVGRRRIGTIWRASGGRSRRRASRLTACGIRRLRRRSTPGRPRKRSRTGAAGRIFRCSCAGTDTFSERRFVSCRAPLEKPQGPRAVNATETPARRAKTARTARGFAALQSSLAEIP